MSNFREDLSGYLKESVEASVGKCYESLYTNLFTTHCILPSNLLRTSRRYNLEKQEASVSFQSYGFLKRNLIRLLLDFLNNFPKRFYSNYTFFSLKPTPFLFQPRVTKENLRVQAQSCYVAICFAKKPYKCRNFLKFGLFSNLSFLIAALRVAKGFFRFWATSEPQLLTTWLRIKNRVL